MRIVVFAALSAFVAAQEDVVLDRYVVPGCADDISFQHLGLFQFSGDSCVTLLESHECADAMNTIEATMPAEAALWVQCPDSCGQCGVAWEPTMDAVSKKAEVEHKATVKKWGVTCENHPVCGTTQFPCSHDISFMEGKPEGSTFGWMACPVKCNTCKQIEWYNVGEKIKAHKADVAKYEISCDDPRCPTAAQMGFGCQSSLIQVGVDKLMYEACPKHCEMPALCQTYEIHFVAAAKEAAEQKKREEEAANAFSCNDFDGSKKKCLKQKVHCKWQKGDSTCNLRPCECAGVKNMDGIGASCKHPDTIFAFQTTGCYVSKYACADLGDLVQDTCRMTKHTRVKNCNYPGGIGAVDCIKGGFTPKKKAAKWKKNAIKNGIIAVKPSENNAGPLCDQLQLAGWLQANTPADVMGYCLGLLQHPDGPWDNEQNCKCYNKVLEHVTVDQVPNCFFSENSEFPFPVIAQNCNRSYKTRFATFETEQQCKFNKNNDVIVGRNLSMLWAGESCHQIDPREAAFWGMNGTTRMECGGSGAMKYIEYAKRKITNPPTCDEETIGAPVWETVVRPGDCVRRTNIDSRGETMSEVWVRYDFTAPPICNAKCSDNTSPGDCAALPGCNWESDECVAPLHPCEEIFKRKPCKKFKDHKCKWGNRTVNGKTQKRRSCYN